MHYFESVCRICAMCQQQLHHSQMSSSAGQRHHCVIIVGSSSVHISTWTREEETNELQVYEICYPFPLMLSNRGFQKKDFISHGCSEQRVSHLPLLIRNCTVQRCPALAAFIKGVRPPSDSCSWNTKLINLWFGAEVQQKSSKLYMIRKI